MIQEHVYARKSETAVYDSTESMEKPAYFLAMGDWMGILERKDGWLHILCIEGDGWVREEEVEKRPPFLLHINWSPGKPIQYISASA